MDTLKDIKPLVDIADHSFTYLLVLLFVVLLMALLAGYFGWKNFQLKRRNDKKRKALNLLKNLDFNDSKLTAYTFSRYANVLVNDNNAVDFEKINTALLAYKYKEKVAQLEPDLIKKIKDFLHV
ncbi:hypothetical protein [uncultured Gammaproteobacteria bacterium]|jgi:hypothetical protein|uniref:hypothetical protein n=1 Tax=thiotrophic endosymbiont of Bathymodiolus puteoserpentis (Logatchev) TaxID=343240 RepID=UPI0010B05C3E|nr:hypothetical protein [thiotrophic endosymbiont of Bathymodiolus puteoserpentis (Logatchev)]CAC9570135.1 hypothetical protein [uncultured Gammaproteobacteria bacterium]CAC9631245.1 hypothetical protein [uncultured Gammaproteobacteria bacterium]CAC9634319.1 hypothetical protein [uncultured Gammaproteobacteria bacterium]CAC9972218.1 hypothetical protein [uncultured Gammaproteobacteria bacterium]CAC9995485.1 hypothetical protein [uncultured Gammaproteobacteria bacterium]